MHRNLKDTVRDRRVNYRVKHRERRNRGVRSRWDKESNRGRLSESRLNNAFWGESNFPNFFMEKKIHISIGCDNVIQYHRFCLVEVCITGKLFLSESNAEFRFSFVVLYTIRTTIFKQNIKWSCLLLYFNQLQKETTSSSNIKRSIGQGNFWSGMRVWLQRQCAQLLSEENPPSEYSQEYTILHACK